jgi:hypothetical protein
MNNIFHVVSDYQKSTYDCLFEIPYLKNYLNSFEEHNEDENYRQVFLLIKNLIFFSMNLLILKGFTRIRTR